METNSTVFDQPKTSTAPIRLTITKLMTATKQGNLDAVRSSLETYGLPANGTKTTDYTVLQTALQRKHKEIAKLLIQHNCNVNNPTDNVDYQPTPLYLAVSLRDDELVAMLLQRGAIIDIRDHRSGQSPAHLAATNRFVTILWRLLHFNTNVNFSDATGKSILQIILEQAVFHRQNSVETVNHKLVRKIIDCKASLNFRSGLRGQTPLHLAALLPQRDVLQILLPNVADLNHTDSEFNSVLHSLLSTKYACFGSGQEQTNLEIVKAMLSRGARPDGVNKRGQVPAHLAAKNRHLNVLLHLLQYERCINRVDHEGKTILHRLLEDFEAINDKLLEPYRKVIKMIVAKGGRGDIHSTSGTTAMHLAAQRSAKDPNVLWLIIQGPLINVNAKDKTGSTILHIIAAESNPNIELVKLMITRGTQVDVKDDKSDMSPIQIAAKNKNMPLLSEFLPHTADVNAVDSADGNTLLHHLLQSSGNQKLVKILIQKGASVDKQNKRGLAPTFYAAESMQISLLLTLLHHSQDLAGQALMKDSLTNRTLLHLVFNALTLEAEGCEVLRILLLNGARIDQLDSKKTMPLQYKVLYNQPDLLDLLVTNVSKINLCGNEGRTLVHYLDQLPFELIQNYEAQVVKITKMLLQCGASLQGTNAKGKSVLDLACRSKELFRVILEYGQDMMMITDANDNSILHTHLMDNEENRNLQTVTILVEKGVSVETQNKNGETPLHLTAKNGELEILQLLIEKAENVNLKDKLGNDVLHILLSTKLTHPPTTTVDETTAVEESAVKPITSKNEKKIIEIIDKLLQKGLIMNAVNDAGETHLHLAYRSFRIDTCRYLLHCGAEPQLCDKLGNSSLHFMAQAGTDTSTDMLTVKYEQEMVWYLMSRGCSANKKNYLGRTALHIAAKHGRTHVVEALVNSGADINCSDSVSGATPLHLAAASRRADVIGILVMSGADINSRQSDGSSVLQLVLHNPLGKDDLDDGLVLHLLELGADPEQRDNYGKTALHWACWNDDRHGLKSLLDHGASLDAEDNGGFPPLHYATGEKTRVDAVLHLTKLQTTGITISEKNNKFLKELIEIFDLKEGIKSMQYEAEVHLMSQVLIDCKTTLYDLLRMDMNTLSLYADNLVLRDLLNSANFDTSFVHYGYLIKSCVHMSKIRKELLTAATDSLSRLAGIPVPFTCSIKIFDSNFKNENLRCLIKAGINARPSRKRRSSCNEDEERPTKQSRRSSI